MLSLSQGERALAAAGLIPGLNLSEVQKHLERATLLSKTGDRTLAFYLAEMSDRRIYQERGYGSTAHYAEEQLDMDRRRTSELIRVGRRLAELQEIDRAYFAGRIGWSKVLKLVKVASVEHEARWLEVAESGNCRDLARVVKVSKPGGPPRDPDDGKGTPEVRFPFSANLPASSHRKLVLAKEKLSAELGRPVTDAEFVDMLSDLALSTEADGSVPGRKRVSSSNYKVVLHDKGRGLLVDSRYGPVPVELEEMYRCDAEVDPVDDGRVSEGRIDIKTSRRLRRAVLHRDGHCCRNCGSTYLLMVHHIVYRSQGGPTVIWNLITLCGKCHGLVHAGLLELIGKRADEIRFRAVEDSGARVSVCRTPSMALEPPARTEAPALVTLETLPHEVDPGWWRRHAHLIRFRRGEGPVFTAGRPSPLPEEDLSERSDKPEASFDDLVGQDACVTRLRQTAEASRLRGRSFPHTLFLGPPGTGKSTLARCLAASCGARLAETTGTTLKNNEQLLRALTSLAQGDMLLIDEIHAVPQAVLETLYQAMTERRVSLFLQTESRSRAIRIRLPRFTLLGATTDEGELHEALYSRFGLREVFDFYGLEDLATLARREADRHGVHLHPAAARHLAAHARGTPRGILRLMDRLLDESARLGFRSVDVERVSGLLTDLGFDEEGLSPEEQPYMALLRGSVGPIALGRLAQLLGQGRKNLTRHVEPWLLRRGLVEVTPRGRRAVRPRDCPDVRTNGSPIR